MHWALQLILFISPIIIIASVFLALFFITRITGGYAPGFQLCCTSCQKNSDASQAGIVRIGAASVKKVVFGYCSNCRGFRWIAIERKPETTSR